MDNKTTVAKVVVYYSVVRTKCRQKECFQKERKLVVMLWWLVCVCVYSVRVWLDFWSASVFVRRHYILCSRPAKWQARLLGLFSATNDSARHVEFITKGQNPERVEKFKSWGTDIRVSDQGDESWVCSFAARPKAASVLGLLPSACLTQGELDVNQPN